MSAKLVSHEENKAVYTVELAWDAFYQATDEVFKKNRNYFQIPGFRKGKAPRKIVEMNYGKEIFYEEALNKLLPALLDEANQKLALEAIGLPDVDLEDIEEGKDILLTITTETKPYPTLGDYKTIEVEKWEGKVEEKDVMAKIEREQKKNAVKVPVEDRPAQEGDEVTINYKGSQDGVAFEGGSAENHQLLLGSNSFIPGFEEQIVGHSIGDSFDIDVTFPEEYHAEDLAGKKAIFHIDLLAITEEELPELDDEFAGDVSEYDTFDEYKASVEKELQEELDRRNKIIQENQAISKLVEISDVHVPDVMIEEEVDRRVRSTENQMKQYGISLEVYLNSMGITEEDYKKEFFEDAKAGIAGNLVLSSLAKDLELEISDEEVDEEIKELAKVYGAKDEEDFAKRMKESSNIDLVISDMKVKKAIEHLMESVQYVEKKEEAEVKEVKAEGEEDQAEDEE